MSDSKKKRKNARITRKKSNKSAGSASKKPRVVNGRPWDDIDIHVAEPKSPETVPPDVQRERSRIIAVVTYASIGLFLLYGLYALATGEKPMMWHIITTVRILLFCSVGWVSGSAVLHSILEKF